MATMPSAATYTAGGRWKATDVNTLTSTDKSFFLAPPFCDLTSATATTLTSAGTWYPIAYDTETADTDSMHDPATNNSRITCVTAGLYLVTATAMVNTPAAVSYLRVGIRVSPNATPDNFASCYLPTTPSSFWGVSVSKYVRMTAGIYVEAVAMSGTAGHTIQVAAGTKPSLQARWISS
jgi:hypothetical protein